MKGLAFNYGLELTFHAHAKQVYAALDLHRLYIREFCAKHGLRGGWPKLAWGGWHTAEYHSPLLTSLDQVELYYQFICSLAKQAGWPIRHPGWVSGGGHLHMSPRVGKWRNLFFAADRAIHRRPCILWAFNDIEDTDEYVDGCVEDHNNHWADFPRSHADFPRSHIELRFFRAPYSPQEQLLHVQFAERWVTKLYRCEQPPKCSSDYLLEDYELATISKRAARNSFLEVVEDLGLRPRDYQMFVTNLCKRFEYGYLRA